MSGKLHLIEKKNNYILETKISFLQSDNMGIHKNVYDSYVIGYDVIRLHV